MTGQLALDFPHRPGYAPGDFMPAESNADARLWLARADEWPSGRFALWGEAGCGKTHLLRVWAAGRGASVIEGSDLRAAEKLRAPLAIDDAEAADERALLHALNDAAEEGRAVLLASRAPPARWATSLPDLASRLRATAAARIDPAEDGLLRALFARLLADRQLVVAEAVQDWLLLRLPRSPAALREATWRLDRAQLAAGNRITRALAADALALHGPAPEESAPTAIPNGDRDHGHSAA